MKKRKVKGLETLKSRYGYIFLAPWIVGMLIFFIVPIVQSAYFSFADITIGDGAVTKFVGLANIKYLLFKDTKYVNNLIAAFTDMFISVPFILLVSLILAVLLNNKFRGRLFFRSLFFLPVIIAGGSVLDLYLSAASGNATEVAVNESVSFGMVDFSAIFSALNLPAAVETYLSVGLDNLFMLVWQSGIQIILFIAGLQSIPDLLYEVSEVEGATKWEEFWFITFPMLSNVTLLVMVYTMVELFISNRNVLILKVYDLMRAAVYDQTSAMMWFYFLIVGGIMGIIVGIYRKCLQNKWY